MKLGQGPQKWRSIWHYDFQGFGGPTHATNIFATNLKQGWRQHEKLTLKCYSHPHSSNNYTGADGTVRLPADLTFPSGRGSKAARQGSKAAKGSKQASKGSKQRKQAKEASKGCKQRKQAKEASKRCKQRRQAKQASKERKQSKQAKEARCRPTAHFRILKHQVRTPCAWQHILGIMQNNYTNVDPKYESDALQTCISYAQV